MDEPIPHIYEFGDFRLDASRRLLLRGGEPVPLTPKVYDTLLHLVERSGTVVSKNELMAAIWPDTVVEENNLGQNISKLRGVFGERPHEHRYIATVPGRGYRFVADVRTVTDDAAELESSRGTELRTGEEVAAGAAVSLSPQSGRPVGRRRRGLPLLLLAAFTAVGLGAAAFYLWRARTRPASAPSVRTIAVLPFKPLAVEGRDEVLELGMADTLITRLSNLGGVTVRPLSAVRRYGGPEQDPFAAGRQLGVEAVLDGHIQRWGDRIRVTARLLRAKDEKQLWAGQFDEKFTDIFAVQDSISQRVTGELSLSLTGTERERLTKHYTENTEAYQLYLKGRFFWNQRRFDALRKAIEFYEEATRRDPNYALAYAGLADCYIALPITSDMPSRDALPKASEAASRALEIDERLAEAHTSLGTAKFWMEWDWAGAEKELRRSLEINPNYALGHILYAHLLSNTGRHPEALREVDRAFELDPLSPHIHSLKGLFLFQMREYTEAARQLEAALELEPNYWVAHVFLGQVYERRGRYEDALAAFRKARESSGGATQALSLMGYTYAVSGRKEEAERTLSELRAISEQRYIPPYNVAMVHAGLRNSDEALTWLERAYDERDVRMVFLNVDPKWDALRSNSRFASLLQRMNLYR